ncbi:hypothetical protein [Chitinophaga pinensis]|uniref:Uncharacterized protein n=1 Tax=Chitinophaga pinensis (strain ATCC 43595 / DSM 2588 / LMG 13176 / NBRC 15968 / NCIMB 11800 / UQM 2034) TaxID=485918 RepID=A0A979G4L4_CHIPD|nr:hypothetical protein [Chitinophaga pinensis]ACU60714.1 hypothetical protein Cpin_3247 [Chitinophaga pinensis DSM 2588]
MTYREYFEQLRTDFAYKTDAYIKAEKQLTEEPAFIDEQVMRHFIDAKSAWQMAANKYNALIDFARLHNVNPDENMVTLSY